MPRRKEYETNAQRQAAYRSQHQDQQPPLQEYLAALGRTLHVELGDAVRAGQSVLPADRLGSQADETLRNLIRYIRQHTHRGQSDPGLNRGSSLEEPGRTRANGAAITWRMALLWCRCE